MISMNNTTKAEKAGAANPPPSQKPKKRQKKTSIAPYSIQNGCITYNKSEDEHYPLCNFVAQVTEEIRRDNGVEVIRLFAIEGKIGDDVNDGVILTL